MKKLHDVLVLNKAWIPIHIISWKKAMCLIYQDHAHSLDNDFIAYNFEDWTKFSIKNGEDYAKVHSASLAIAIPEIITLVRYDKLPTREVKYSRENVFHRDHYKCQYCGNIFPIRDLTVDHIVPRSKGGKTIWNNIASSCKPCNNIKANRTPEEAHMRLIRKPIKPKWLNPIDNVKGKIYICKSWLKFMDRVSDNIESDDI
jgi:5-methylcytosine-specific restriction endonuclease McrA